MAELEVEDGELILRLSCVEKTEAVHTDLYVPLSAVASVEVLDDAHEMTRVNTGFKVGMRIPGRDTVAVVRRAGRCSSPSTTTRLGACESCSTATPTTSGSWVRPTPRR